MKNACGLSLIPLFLLTIGFSSAQDVFPTAITAQNQNVNLPFPESFGGDVDQVSIANGNLTIHIPIVTLKGRGLTYNFGLRYGNAFWTVLEPYGPNPQWVTTAGNYLPGHVLGWETSQPYATWILQFGKCGINGTTQDLDSYIFTDSDGAKHLFAVGGGGGTDCEPEHPLQVGSYSYSNTYAPDTVPDGLSASTDSGSSLMEIGSKDGTTWTVGGTAPSAPGNYRASGFAQVTDTNGNVQVLAPGGADSIGRIPVTVTTNGSQQILYTVKDSNGNPQTYTVNLETVAIQTAFATGATEVLGSTLEVQSIDLPNGQAYSFSYDSYGDVTEMTVPSGAQIFYTWATFNQGSVGNTHRYVTSRTTKVNGVTEEWQLSIPVPSSGCNINTVTDPSNNQQVYSFTSFGTNYYLGEGSPCSFASSIKFYNGSATGTPIRQYTITQFDPTNFPNGSGLIGTIDTTLQNGSISRKQYTYNESKFTYHIVNTGTYQVQTTTPIVSNGDIASIQEYDWGNGAPGPLLRQTFRTYSYQVDSSNPLYNPLSRVVEQDVFDGTAACTSASGCTAHLVAKTLNTYDGNNSDITHGNLTSSSRMVSSSAGYVTTSYAYDGYGNITSETDPKGNVTSWSYTNQWNSSTNTCDPTGSSAYPTTKTDALNHMTSYAWRACTGQLQSVQDPNDLANSRPGTVYGYDEMNNVVSTSYPDGGSIAYNYNGYALPLTVTTTRAASPDPSLVKTVIYDGLNRPSQAQLADSAGVIYTNTSYDAMGRVASVTNPFNSTSDPTYGSTTYTYDALGRKTIQTQPDDSKLQWCYNGIASQGQTNCSAIISTLQRLPWTDYSDESGHHWQRAYDGLGRLGAVLEPNPSTGSQLETDYLYDALNNLLRLDQWGGLGGSAGVRTRTFVYDSLSRLTNACNPEVLPSGSSCSASGPWSATYTYDANGNVITKVSPLQNQTTTAIMTTTNTYDALNRLTSEAYSDGVTPTNYYLYDVAPNWMPDLQNVIGRMANSGNQFNGMANSSATATTYSYDPMGRIIRKWEQTPSIAPGGYYVYSTYDLAGNLTSNTNAAGTKISYSYDAASRLTGATSSLKDAQHPSTLYSVDPTVGYYPNGSVRKALLGNGLTETQALNNRLQPCRMNVNSTATQPLATIPTARTPRLPAPSLISRWATTRAARTTETLSHGRQ